MQFLHLGLMFHPIHCFSLLAKKIISIDTISSKIKYSIKYIILQKPYFANVQGRLKEPLSERSSYTSFWIVRSSSLNIF